MRKQMLRQYRNMWIYAGFMLVILSLLTGMHCFLLRKIHISVQEIRNSPEILCSVIFLILLWTLVYLDDIHPALMGFLDYLTGKTITDAITVETYRMRISPAHWGGRALENAFQQNFQVIYCQSESGNRKLLTGKFFPVSEAYRNQQKITVEYGRFSHIILSWKE